MCALLSIFQLILCFNNENNIYNYNYINPFYLQIFIDSTEKVLKVIDVYNRNEDNFKFQNLIKEEGC
jgi:hypothetical protein